MHDKPTVDYSRYKELKLDLRDRIMTLTLSNPGRKNAVTPVMNAELATIWDDLWLDPGIQNVAAISELLKPYDASQMQLYPVSSRVNHVTNDDEECSRPVEIVEPQHPLFS